MYSDQPAKGVIVSNVANDHLPSIRIFPNHSPDLLIVCMGNDILLPQMHVADDLSDAKDLYLSCIKCLLVKGTGGINTPIMFHITDHDCTYNRPGDKAKILCGVPNISCMDVQVGMLFFVG